MGTLPEDYTLAIITLATSRKNYHYLSQNTILIIMDGLLNMIENH
jgi:hypothetical protein